MQSFDAKNEVLLSRANVPHEDMLEMLCKKQFHYLAELEPLVALYLQDTVQKGEAASYSRLMVRRYVEQKIRDNNFNARNEDQSLQGATAWKGNPRGNPKCDLPFFPAFQASGFPFSCNLSYKNGESEIRVKNNKFSISFCLKNALRCQIYHKTAGFLHIAH